ncbi:MAG: hypothetical protein R3F27_12415 [Gammaproteobacteria bacterium]
MAAAPPYCCARSAERHALCGAAVTGLKATIVVEPGGITVPLIIGYAGTMVGLYAYFGLAGIQTNSLFRRLLGACCLTFSTIGNHFSAMGQTRFYTEQNLGTTLR